MKEKQEEAMTINENLIKFMVSHGEMHGKGCEALCQASWASADLAGRKTRLWRCSAPRLLRSFHGLDGGFYMRFDVLFGRFWYAFGVFQWQI